MSHCHKIAYHVAAHAHAAAIHENRRLRTRSHNRLHVYRCHQCRAWHLGRRLLAHERIDALLQQARQGAMP